MAEWVSTSFPSTTIYTTSIIDTASMIDIASINTTRRILSTVAVVVGVVVADFVTNYSYVDANDHDVIGYHLLLYLADRPER